MMTLVLLLASGVALGLLLDRKVVQPLEAKLVNLLATLKAKL